jgi:uncharacterized membrane protein YfcA
MELVIEFIIIFLLTIFQSLFGVGLLLFGTPIFLFIGYSFETTLFLLLPISISISFLQIVYQKSSIKSLVLEYNIFCLPFLVLFLIIAITLKDMIDIRIYVSIFLIITSLIILNKNRIIRRDKYLLKYRKIYLILIGSIHGLTNMGGGFLSVFSTLINGGDRVLTRKYISYGYFVMGILQYTTILFIGLNNIDFTKLYYVFLVLFLFFPSQKIFNKLNDQLFIKIINYIALTFGIIGLIMSLK